MMVAMVIPEIGLFVVPISPTILEDTVTKNAPNTTINNPMNKRLKNPLPGIKGINAIRKISAMLPNKTTLMLRSLSVLNRVSVPPFSFTAETLSLNEEMMVGMVLISVIKPPIATAPAPICLIYARYIADAGSAKVFVTGSQPPDPPGELMLGK